MRLRTGFWLFAWSCCCSLGWTQEMSTPRGYYPLQHPLPPGRAGHWAGLLGRHHPTEPQFVRFHLPSTGQLTWYTAQGSVPADTSMLSGLLVGPVYRVQLSDLPEFPGATFYPTVELIDRLHPPADRIRDFPVPLTLTLDELTMALSGRMVTKVIYLEQPNRARPVNDQRGAGLPTIQVSPDVNPLESADQLGRPIAIVRLGGRRFDPQQLDPAFIGLGAPVVVEPAPTVVPAVAAPAPVSQPIPSRKPATGN